MSADAWPSSLQIIASKALGGAERWAQRFAVALAEQGAPASIAVRAGSDLAGLDMGGLTMRTLPFLAVWDPISRGAITRLVRELRPDLVQTYMGRATRLTHLSGHPVHVARLGGYYKLGPYRHADAWIGNTRRLADWMIEQGLPVERVHHIYNFVEQPRPDPAAKIERLRASLAIPPDAWVIAALGRFVVMKGHRFLLDALARLPAEIAGRPWRMLLLGDGPLRSALLRQAADLGIGDRLVWAGWQCVPGPYLQLADLIVFPSLEYEPFGNVILDAWAWQRPLVATRFFGALEVVRHGEDGWCVPCEDPPALAEAIRRLLDDDELRAALARRGAERAAAEFGKQAIMAQYRDLYRQLVWA
jgi:glycosyltransferase involved in cell wall biosynthesis